MYEKGVDGESAGERIFLYNDSSSGSKAEGEMLKERYKQWKEREIAWWRQEKNLLSVYVCVHVCSPYAHVCVE